VLEDLTDSPSYAAVAMFGVEASGERVIWNLNLYNNLTNLRNEF